MEKNHIHFLFVLLMVLVTLPHKERKIIYNSILFPARRKKMQDIIIEGPYSYDFYLFAPLSSSSVSTSAGSGPTSLLEPATLEPMLPLATTMATTWCRSCLSTETETTSCPTRLWDMSMPTCWTLVSTERQTFSQSVLNFWYCSPV